MDDLSFEGADQPVRAEDDRAVGHAKHLILHDALDVVSRVVSLPDRSGGQVEELIAVFLDICIQFSYTLVTPVLAEAGEHMAKHIALGDGAVNVRDYYSLRVVPEENAPFDHLLTLDARLDGEGNFIRTIPQVKLF